MTQGYHLIGLELQEEATIADGLVVRILLLFFHKSCQAFLIICLRGLQANLVSLIGEEEIEIIDAQAIHLHHVVGIKMLQDMEHSVNAIEWIESRIIHRK